jgi:hypothetical protein
MDRRLALQLAVYAALQGDTVVMDLSGGAIFDAVPPGCGSGIAREPRPRAGADRADKTGPGALHEFSVLVVSDGAGFATAKALAVAVSDALDNAALTLSRGTLVSLDFRRATARRSGDRPARSSCGFARVSISARSEHRNEILT